MLDIVAQVLRGVIAACPSGLACPVRSALPGRQVNLPIHTNIFLRHIIYLTLGR